ncbi:hypothetical protein ABZX60_10145 [Streptomyces olivaceus]|uniref:hypothetical protein n=1 Tax=Streptomyces olivaceus TaxID=47716 RepID=UPI0033AAEE37
MTDLFDALDVRAGRDALGAWRTAWEAERLAPVVAAEAGPDDLIPLRHAARQLLRDGRRVELLAAYTRRHPDPAAWAGDAPAQAGLRGTGGRGGGGARPGPCAGR